MPVLMRKQAAQVEFLGVFLEGFPDLHLEVLDSSADEGMVAQRILFTGTHTGPRGMEVPPHIERPRIPRGREVAGAVKMPVLAAKQDPARRKVAIGRDARIWASVSQSRNQFPASRWRPG